MLAIFMSARFFVHLGPKLQQLFRSPAMLRKDEGLDADLLMKALDQSLNSGKRIMVGGLSAVGILIYYGSRLFVSENIGLPFLGYLDLVLFSVPTCIYQYFVGTLVWRFAVTISFLNRLPKSFEIKPVTFHPDKATGLDPIGYISTQILLVFSVPTIASAFALLIPVVNRFTDIQVPGFNATAYLYVVPSVLLLSLIGILFGLMPVHSIVSAGKLNLDDVNESRDIASEKIIRLKRRCLEHTEEEGFDLDSALVQMN